MPAYTFASLLKELGEKIGIPNLEPTENNNIVITLAGKNDLILEQHKSQPFLIISFEITEIPAGRFRENILREALKFNDLNQVHGGVMAFSKKTQKLVLFEMLPMNDIHVDQLYTVMKALSEKATLWKESLSRGEAPSLTSFQGGKGAGPNIFGMRP